MDKFILNKQIPSGGGIVVKIDGEAAQMICELQSKTYADKKYIVSEMIKFCFERAEIRDRKIEIKEMREDDCWE